MLDFPGTYQRRRAITRLLQESQARESRTLKQIGQHATDCKRQILELLSRWLQRLKAEADCPPAHFHEMAALSRVPLRQWLELQRAAAALELRLRPAQADEQAANARCTRLAPAGFLSRWLAGPDTKVEIRKLELAAALARKAREAVEAEMEANLRERKRLGEALLRDWVERCDALSRTQAVGKEVTEYLARMTRAINATWEAHRGQELKVLEEVSRSADELRSAYATPGASLLGPADAGGGDSK